MSNAVDKISQFNIERSPDYKCRKQQKTKQIHPEASLKRKNKNVAEKIK
jgi:hypothetical protein